MLYEPDIDPETMARNRVWFGVVGGLLALSIVISGLLVLVSMGAPHHA